MYLGGYAVYSIARDLTKRSIKTPAGCDVWSPSTVRSILTNEKIKAMRFSRNAIRWIS
nr:recombinase family protein [Pectinatus frisingensis]